MEQTMAFANSTTGPRSPLLTPLARNWGLIALRGVLAILFGIVCIAWPGVALTTFIWLFAVFALVDGVFSIGAAITGGSMMPRWWLAVVGIAGIAAGLIAAFNPGATALVLLTFIGAWSIVRGIFEIAGAIAVRKEIDNEWMLILGGAISVLFGLYVLIFPGEGALAILVVIGIWSIIAGVMMIGFAFRLRRHSVRT
jgi:uncharacterized membrane protein HdeD (DUF308 family)